LAEERIAARAAMRLFVSKAALPTARRSPAADRKQLREQDRNACGDSAVQSALPIPE
jgi:hypothetical protein